MKPARVDFATGNNEDGGFVIALTMGDGSPFPFAGYTAFRMQVKASRLHPVAEIELTDADGLTIDAGAGTISGTVPLATLQTMFGIYDYDIVGTATGGQVDRIVEGVIDVRLGVTN
jgi:hypothetical protein